MSDTDRTEAATGAAGRVRINPSTAEGRSKLLLFGGLCVLAGGHLLGAGTAVWVGLAVTAVAFALNTAGKLVHYRSLPIPGREQLLLSATWTLLAVTVVGLFTTYAFTRYGPGSGSFFWSLAVAGIGFALLHMAAQSKYLPASELPAEE